MPRDGLGWARAVPAPVGVSRCDVRCWLAPCAPWPRGPASPLPSGVLPSPFTGPASPSYVHGESWATVSHWAKEGGGTGQVAEGSLPACPPHLSLPEATAARSAAPPTWLQGPTLRGLPRRPPATGEPRALSTHTASCVFHVFTHQPTFSLSTVPLPVVVGLRREPWREGSSSLSPPHSGDTRHQVPSPRCLRKELSAETFPKPRECWVLGALVETLGFVSISYSPRIVNNVQMVLSGPPWAWHRPAFRDPSSRPPSCVY